MRALLDINVLIALFDPDHSLHQRAHEWWSGNSGEGWASCPISENGMIRIMRNINYSSKERFTPGELIDRLKTFSKNSDHEFWPDELSLLDEKIFNSTSILGSKSLTDIYLLALAVENDGRLITFDQKIPTTAVARANGLHICHL